MSLNIDISIIIPVYNGIPYLKECINTLKRQNHSLLNIEILFIDDGSKDKSEDYIKSFNLN